jgi:glucokinase
MTILVVDIGGTYIRLSLSSDGQTFIRDPNKIKTDKFSSFENAIESYLHQINIKPDSIQKILVARSGRNNWNIDESRLKAIFVNSHFTLVNDFAANAMGLIKAQQDDLLYLAGHKKSPDTLLPRAVIGSGTGLGLAYISRTGEVQRTHGGHMRPPYGTPEHHQIFEDLQNLKASKTDLIVEDALSGTGIYNIYKILSHRHHLECEYIDANHLIAEGRNNPIVIETLRLYHEILGLFAHHVLAYGYSYGGLFLTGGITDRLMGQNLFDTTTFLKFLYRPNVPVVLHDVQSTPIFWVKDEFISLKGLLVQALEE